MRNSIMAMALGLAVVFAAGAYEPIQAAPACKGLKRTQCLKKSGCTWRKGYKRKDGKSVRGHCRTGTVKKKSMRKKTTTTKKKTKKKR